MQGILIQYHYDGDESDWQRAIDGFLANIAADDRLKGRFNYRVFQKNEDGSRVHLGSWDTEETLSHLQSQPFFKEFSGAVKAMAEDTLVAQRLTAKAFSSA